MKMQKTILKLRIVKGFRIQLCAKTKSDQTVDIDITSLLMDVSAHEDFAEFIKKHQKENGGVDLTLFQEDVHGKNMALKQENKQLREAIKQMQIELEGQKKDLEILRKDLENDVSNNVFSDAELLALAKDQSTIITNLASALKNTQYKSYEPPPSVPVTPSPSPNDMKFGPNCDVTEM